MWRSKKFIIGIVLAAVLLLGSLGGAVLADDSQPGVGFIERLAEKLGISAEELKDKMTEAKGEMPDKGFGKWQGRRGPAGSFGSCLEELGIEVDLDALKAALTEAREEIKGQDDVDHRAVMAGVLESFGINVDELKDKFAGDADCERPFKNGFKGPRGMGGMRGFGGPCAPAE